MNMPLVLLNRRRRGGFSPGFLFSSGSQGIWLDPSDVANLDWRRNLLTYTEQFENAVWTKSGSTISVNAAVAPDGMTTADKLVEDTANSQHAVVVASGSRPTIAVGNHTHTVYVKVDGRTAATLYNNGTSGGAGASFSLTSGTVTQTGGTQYVSSTITAVGNDWYRLSLTFLSVGGTAELTVYIGSAFSGEIYTGNGTSGILIWGAQLELGSVATDYQRISDVNTEVLERFPRTTMFQDRAGTTPVTTPGQTVGKRLDKSGRGNHAVAPTDAARPTYGIEPKTGRRNLLTRTEEFGDAVWDKGTGGSISTNSAVAPDGTTTADVYTWASTTGSFAHLSQTVSGQNPAQNFTFSIWIKRPAGSGSRILRLRMSDVTTSTGESVQTTVTESWQRFSFTRASATNTGSIGVGLSQGASGTIATGDLLEVWGAQLELGSTATAYQRVGTAFDVTEAGVATVHYIQYDGTDDSFSTSSINFTATDKMSVFAGVRKLSDAALGMAAELSVDASANSGSFRLVMPGSAGYEYRQRGSLNATGAGVSSGFAAPITNVITGLGDISGDSTILRINGTQVAQSTSDQGTGNFGNYPLFIGRRNNTSLPFNGRDYGIIIVGKTASATEITNTESYLAANTSGVSI